MQRMANDGCLAWAALQGHHGWLRTQRMVEYNGSTKAYLKKMEIWKLGTTSTFNIHTSNKRILILKLLGTVNEDDHMNSLL